MNWELIYAIVQGIVWLVFIGFLCVVSFRLMSTWKNLDDFLKAQKEEE